MATSRSTKTPEPHQWPKKPPGAKTEDQHVQKRETSQNVRPSPSRGSRRLHCHCFLSSCTQAHTQAHNVEPSTKCARCRAPAPCLTKSTRVGLFVSSRVAEMRAEEGRKVKGRRNPLTPVFELSIQFNSRIFVFDKTTGPFALYLSFHSSFRLPRRQNE